MMYSTNGIQKNGLATRDRQPSLWGRVNGSMILIVAGIVTLGIPAWVAPSSHAVQADRSNKDKVVRELTTKQSLLPEELTFNDPRFPPGLSVATVGTEGRMRQEFPDKQEVTAQIAREVDFGQQRLVILRWSGSGQDTFEPVASDGVVTFQFKRGRTRDLRAHCQAFILDKNRDFSVRK